MKHLLLLGVIFSISGCLIYRAPTRYYSLGVSDIEQPVAAKPTGGDLNSELYSCVGRSLGVGPIALPAEWARSEIVVSQDQIRRTVLERDLWASPLQGQIERLLAEELRRKINPSRIQFYPWPLAAAPTCSFGVQIVELTIVLGEELRLSAELTVKARSDDESVRLVTRREELKTSDIADAIMILRKMIVELADSAVFNR